MRVRESDSLGNAMLLNHVVQASAVANSPCSAWGIATNPKRGVARWRSGIGRDGKKKVPAAEALQWRSIADLRSRGALIAW